MRIAVRVVPTDIGPWTVFCRAPKSTFGVAGVPTTALALLMNPEGPSTKTVRAYLDRVPDLRPSAMTHSPPLNGASTAIHAIDELVTPMTRAQGLKGADPHAQSRLRRLASTATHAVRRRLVGWSTR